MTYAVSNPEKAHFLQAMGAELRELREQTGYTLEFVASVLNPETASRDRMSKVERGVLGIDMHDYLRLMWFYRDLAPKHPAVLLAKRLLSKKTRDGA